MAARGTESKNAIFSKILEVYPEAFWEDKGKILRIPQEENGEIIEIKVTLTAAKNNLGAMTATSAFDNVPEEAVETKDIEPTEEEKERVSQLIAALNF